MTAKIVKALIHDTGWPLDGHEIYLARWPYDPQHWHLYFWEKDADEAVMLTIYQTETEAGLRASGSFSEFETTWKAGEYETDCAFIIEDENVQVLEENAVMTMI